jgi:hypothetical protein
MSSDPLTEKLSKAAANLRKLSEFFAARRSWPAAAGAEQALQDVAAAARSLDEQLKRLITECNAEPREAELPAVAELAAGELDANRLNRFATFLRDLARWFEAQPGPPSQPEGIAVLQNIEASVGATIELVAGTSTVPTPEMASPEDQSDVVSEAGKPADPDDNEPKPSAPSPDDVDFSDRPSSLVLDDTEERPLVQEFRDIKELTPICEELVDEFLTSWGINYSHYERKKFLEKLLRWISTAPHGQALVLKISVLKDPIEPYPSYISRELLRENPLPSAG